MNREQRITFSLVVIAIVLSVLGAVIVSDTLWCVENWGFHEEVISCLYYENSVFGRFIQP